VGLVPKALPASDFNAKAAGGAISGALQGVADKIAQQGQQASAQALKMIMDRQKDPRLEALMQADPLAPLMAGGGAESNYLRQLFDKYFGPTPTYALQPDFTDQFPLIG
jgi:hypothetical protein